MIQPTHVLVIAPHPDDFELGLGATAAKWADAGIAIMVLMLSDRGEKSWMAEALQAAKVIGRNGAIRVETLHQTVFHFSSERQAILRAFEAYRERIKPDVVFAPAEGELHQDHQAAMAEARRVFKGITLLGYEIIRSNMRFRPTMFVPVTPDHVARKVDGVACYSSQTSKAYTQAAAIEGLAAVRGAQCDSPTGLAEAFAIEWLCCK